jgi:hypothetical protein
MGKRNQKVNPQRKREWFTNEFKLEAVRLLERGEKAAADCYTSLIPERDWNRWDCPCTIALSVALPGGVAVWAK